MQLDVRTRMTLPINKKDGIIPILLEDFPAWSAVHSMCRFVQDAFASHRLVKKVHLTSMPSITRLFLWQQQTTTPLEASSVVPADDDD